MISKQQPSTTTFTLAGTLNAGATYKVGDLLDVWYDDLEEYRPVVITTQHMQQALALLKD